MEQVKGIQPSFRVRLISEAWVGFHLSPKMKEIT
jgi:hypothetical protein